MDYIKLQVNARDEHHARIRRVVVDKWKLNVYLFKFALRN